MEVSLGRDLLDESLGTELETQHRHADLAVALQVLGQVDGGQAPSAELSFDAVAIREGR